MNVKIKLSIEQFKWLLNFVHNKTNESISNYTEVQLINLKCFIAKGFKKLIDLNSELQLTPNKIKTFTIEFNQFECVYNLLQLYYDSLDAFTLAIYTDMQRQKTQYKKITNFK